MNNLQTSTINMHLSLNTFLDANSTLINADAALLAAVTNFKNNFARINDLGNLLAIDKIAYSHEKRTLKIALAHQLANIGALARVGLQIAGLKVAAEQLETANTSYMQLADPDLIYLANANRTIISDNLAALSPAYVAATDLASLDTAIANFTNAKGSSDNAHKNNPAIRKEFTLQLRENSIVVQQIRLLARRYIKSNPVFYEQLLNEATISKTNIRHTNLNLNIISKLDNSPIQDAFVNFDKNKKTGESDINGKVQIDKIKNGEITIMVKADGYMDAAQTIHIEQGVTNEITISLEKAA
jgi:nucleoside diphosphate kinase